MEEKIINRTMTTECPIKYICSQNTEFCGDIIYKKYYSRKPERSPMYHRCQYFISLKNFVLETIKESEK